MSYIKDQEFLDNSEWVEYVGFWPRLAAYWIDGLILSLVNLPIFLIFTFLVRIGVDKNIFHIILNIIVCAVVFTYQIYFVSGKWQATPGKRIMGIYIIRGDGRPISPSLALGRYFAQILSALPLDFGYLMITWTEQCKSLHDMICKTRVVYGKR